MESLIELGVDTVLTSGQVGTAVEGIENLKNLVTQADDRIEIMAGGKVAPENAKLLLENTGAHTLHASLGVAGKNYSALEKVQQLKNCIADREE